MLAWWREETPVSVVDPREVHAIYRVAIEELLDPQHRISVRHPSGWRGPAFLIGDDKDLILWGFTAGVIARLFDFLGWARPDEDVPPRPPLTKALALPDEGLRGNPAEHARPGRSWCSCSPTPCPATGRASSPVPSRPWGCCSAACSASGSPPRLLGDAAPALWVSLAALFVVLVCASFGQAVLQYAGARIRDRIKWQPVRALDAVGGAALSMVAVLVVRGRSAWP